MRSQIVQGEQLLELQRDGNWYGVRVLQTGEEGWIFGDLIEPLTASTLGGGAGDATAGFAELSRDFDRLMGNLTQRYGFPLFDRADELTFRRASRRAFLVGPTTDDWEGTNDGHGTVHPG